MKLAERKKLLTIFLISFFVVVLDQSSKFLIVKGFINVHFITNTGAGFGLFKESAYLLAWFAVAVVGVIIYYYDKISVKDRIEQVSIALILGGTVGNLIDRAILGHVIDFIDLKIWPLFNIADSAISIGICLLIFYMVKKK